MSTGYYKTFGNYRNSDFKKTGFSTIADSSVQLKAKFQ
jgi:hypothetical protein